MGKHFYCNLNGINKSVEYEYYGNLFLYCSMSWTLRNNKLVNGSFVKTAKIILWCKNVNKGNFLINTKRSLFFIF